MDNFNIHKYFKNQYITESKPVDESFDFDKYNKVTDQFKKELKSMIGDYNTSVSMRDYSGDRDDSDPLKNKGFGSIDFYYRDELPQNDFNKVVKWAEGKGFEIESASNYYEIEYDNDRAFYPRIKFNFDVSKAEELLEGTCGYSIDGKPANKPAGPELNENRAQDLAAMYSLKDLNDILRRIYGEMEQEAEPEGGPIANQYADEIYQYEEAIRIKKGVGQRGRKDITYDQAIGREDITDETGTYTLRPDGTKDYKKINVMNESKFKIGDKVVFKGNEDGKILTVTDMRKMFASDLMAYMVKFPDGKEAEYDETQLVSKENIGLPLGEEEYSLDFGELDEMLKEQGKSDTEVKEILSKLLKLNESNKVKAQELTEKLCKKGEAYRKRRMAAGEKSSAYLSGRAVKVCKGQMSGKKKKK